MNRSQRTELDAKVDAPPAFEPRPFVPPWWLRNPHMQTLAGKFLRRAPELPLRREALPTPDGDVVELDHPPSPDTPAGTVLVLHGLEGSTKRNYMRTMYAALAEAGFRAVGMNFRSCGGAPPRTARTYHSGDTRDLRFVLEHLAERYPAEPRAAAGFSLGGNVLLKFLGEAGDEAKDLVSAAAAISVPFELSAGATRIERGVMGWFYTYYFMRMLRRKTASRGALLNGTCDVAAGLRARTIRTFDEAVTAPLNGFRDAEDYYGQSSSAGYIADIRVPTLLLHAEDDPFLPAAAIPRAAAEANPWVTPAFTPQGGHVAFVSGSPLAPVCWAEAEAARFLASVTSRVR